MKEIKVVELFAGVGGFRLGLEKSSKATFKTIWANQWEPHKQKQHAFNCYNEHFGYSKNHINQDIASAKFNIPNNIDLLVGGFPCQDYSVARTQAAGINGEKGVLWWEISWIIKEKKPKMILLENVDRLLKSPKLQKGRDFGLILRNLYDNGYYVEWRVINAAEYGFLQKRRRTFIFAYKKNLNFLKIKNNDISTAINLMQEKGFFAKNFTINNKLNPEDIKTIDIKEKYDNLSDISKNFQFDFENSGCMIDSKIFTTKSIPNIDNKKIKLLKDIIIKTKVDKKYFLNDKQYEKIKLLKDRKQIERKKPNGEKYYYSEGQMSFPDRIDAPARTMLTSEGTINRSSHIINDPLNKKIRFLTPIETERINGFPDNWTNTNMPERFRYFCMGNALVVDLVKTMGNTIQELWNQKYNKSKINKKISIISETHL